MIVGVTYAAVLYRCSYYKTAQPQLYGTLDVSTAWETSYWSQLSNTNLTTSACNIDLPTIPYKFRAAFLADPSNPTCGEYLQLTSLYPGRGPCYPVLVPTVDYLDRYPEAFWHVLMVALQC